MPFSLLALYRWVKLVISPRLAAVRVRSICGELRWCRTYVSNSHYWKYDGGGLFFMMVKIMTTVVMAVMII